MIRLSPTSALATRLALVISTTRKRLSLGESPAGGRARSDSTHYSGTARRGPSSQERARPLRLATPGRCTPPCSRSTDPAQPQPLSISARVCKESTATPRSLAHSRADMATLSAQTVSGISACADSVISNDSAKRHRLEFKEGERQCLRTHDLYPVSTASRVSRPPLS